MKIEQFLKTLFIVVCTMTMAFNLASCSEEDEVSTIITYTAQGSLSASSGDAFEALYGITAYTDAITKVLGDSYTTTEKDNEVISACDAVFKNHKTNHPTWSGYIEIEKTIFGTSGETVSSTIIKTYKYE